MHPAAQAPTALRACHSGWGPLLQVRPWATRCATPAQDSHAVHITSVFSHVQLYLQGVEGKKAPQQQAGRRESRWCCSAPICIPPQ